MFDSKSLQVYFICGTQDIIGDQNIKDVLKAALESGITLFQFREKGPNALVGMKKKP